MSVDRKQLKEQTVIEENRVLRGFTVHVLEDWGNKVKKRFITPREKELYEQEFGNEMITDSVFFNWWSRINGLGKHNL
jgi:hypothetical protein